MSEGRHSAAYTIVGLTKNFAQLDERQIFSVTILRLLFQTLPALTYALALADIRFRQ